MDNNRTPIKEKNLFSTSVSIPQEERIDVINILNQDLANTLDLYSQTKQAHWNVKGSDFIQLHEFFDRIADMIFPYIDKIAERVMALGGTAMGTARMSAENSDLDEFPIINDGMKVVEALAERYAIVANYSREGIDTTEDLGDMASSDLLIEYVRALDKALWFLEAHIQK
jgi:starvation-inducible DNA-binding protein